MIQESRYLTSSHPKSVALNSTNSGFTISLDNSIRIPVESKNISVYCASASVVNFFYNISTALNNNIIYWTDASGTPQKYTITLPDGAYDYTDINSYLKNYFTQQGQGTDTVRLLGQTATQKIVLEIKNGFGVRFPAGIADILGFTANYTQFNNNSVPYFYEASSPAKFNKIISLNLNSSITNSTFYNGEFSNTCAVLPIDVPVGSLLNYKGSVNPIRIRMNTLAGQTINQISVWLRDQDDNNITIGEKWNVVLVIEYDL